MPFRSSGGGASAQRARTGSFGLSGRCRFGGRAALRARLVGSGVLGPDDLAEAELVLEELAHSVVVERARQVLGPLGVRDLDPLVQVMGRDEVTLVERVKARVLEVPDRTGLADRSALETNQPRLLGDDLRVRADLALRRCALLFRDICRKREFRGLARHGPR